MYSSFFAADISKPCELRYFEWFNHVCNRVVRLNDQNTADGAARPAKRSDFVCSLSTNACPPYIGLSNAQLIKLRNYSHPSLVDSHLSHLRRRFLLVSALPTTL